MVRVAWNGKVIAECDDALKDDDAYYFPKKTIAKGALVPSGVEGHNARKGRTIHFDLWEGRHVERLVAWEYQTTTDATAHLQGLIGFKMALVERDSSNSPASCQFH